MSGKRATQYRSNADGNYKDADHDTLIQRSLLQDNRDSDDAEGALENASSPRTGNGPTDDEHGRVCGGGAQNGAH